LFAASFVHMLAQGVPRYIFTEGESPYFYVNKTTTRSVWDADALWWIEAEMALQAATYRTAQYIIDVYFTNEDTITITAMASYEEMWIAVSSYYNGEEWRVPVSDESAVSIGFAEFADGLYAVGVVFAHAPDEVIPQGTLAKHESRVVWHPLPLAGYAHVPVLMYHHIDAHVPNVWVVTPESFAVQMRTLRNFGFNPVNSAQMVAFVEAGTPLPPRPVMITFDDGYLSTYIYAFPILQYYGMTATNFIIGHAVGTDTYKDTGHPTIPKFNFDQARRMAGVVDIQSHSYDMHQTPALEQGRPRQFMLQWQGESAAAFAEVLTCDHQRLYDLVYAALGESIIAVAFPHGRYDDLTHEILLAAGVRITFGTRPGISTLRVGDAQSLIALYRINIDDTVDGELLLYLLGK